MSEISEESGEFSGKISVHRSVNDSEADYVLLDMLAVDEEVGSEMLGDHLRGEPVGLTQRSCSRSRASTAELAEEKRLRHSKFESPKRAQSQSSELCEGDESGVVNTASSSSISPTMPDCEDVEGMVSVLCEDTLTESVKVNRWAYESEDTSSTMNMQATSRTNVKIGLSTSDQAAVLSTGGTSAQPESRRNPSKRFLHIKTSNGLSTVKEVTESILGESEASSSEPSRREELLSERMQKLLEEK
eukprot:scpid97047/ scgid31968/ 